MRVLHVQRAKGIGGSERHLLALLPGLVEAGVDVRMCVLVLGDGLRFVRALQEIGIEVITFEVRGNVQPRAVGQLFGTIRRLRPDVVHTHLVHADLHGQLAAAGARVPGVSSVHGTPAFYLREPYRSAGRLAGRLARVRIAISAHVATFLRNERLAPAERIRVVHYGIDVERFASTRNERAVARAQFGLTDSDVAIGIAARLIEGKGHEDLVLAASEAVGECPQLRVLVAGDGPERSAIQALADRTCPPSVVQMLGFLDDVRGFMAACDVLGFPTRLELSEGFGLAALEGMAAGRPVIATDVGSLGEVVIDHETGLLVPPGSRLALRDAMVALAIDRSQRVEFGKAAAARVCAEFPLARMVERTISVYEEVA